MPKAGVEPTTFALRMRLPIKIKDKHLYYAAWFWPNKPVGTVINIQNPNIKSQFDIAWRIKEGEILNGSIFLGDSPYRMLLWNKSLKNLLSDIQELESESTSIQIGN